MIDAMIMGAVQGITEWLPISSEGMVTLLMAGKGSLTDIIRYALFLHLGTLMAALAYFRKDVLSIMKKWRGKEGPVCNFLLLSTMASGVVALFLLRALEDIQNSIAATADAAMLLVGGMLLFTSFMQFAAKGKGLRKTGDANMMDSLIAGFMQGLSIIPGISRSGMTVSALLIRGFGSREALRLSFLMSIPAVFAANVVLNMGTAWLSAESLASLCFAFVFGMATIGLLMRISERINFAYFTLAFGLITIAATML